MKFQLHAGGKEDHQFLLKQALDKKIKAIATSTLFNESEKKLRITKLRQEHKKQIDAIESNLY